MIKSFNRQRKIVSLLLALAMILTALPLAGFTAFAEKDGDFEYVVLEDGTAEITDYTGSAETLDIPSKLDTYTVTSIGDSAFAYNNSLTSVTIPDSVISIGEGAFYFCGLTSITIGKGVTRIGEYAFSDNEYSANPSNWENGALYIDNYLIEANDVPENYTINEGTRVIADRAFEDCDSLTSVTIPNSVINIGEGAFEYCDSITEINVDTNNKNYSSQDGVLFNKNKTELIQYPIGNERTSYNIPNSVTSIGESAFYECSGLTSVTIPNSVTSIGDDAFAFCNSLTSVTIPESVTSIGEGAFWSCSKLTSVTIGNGVISIGRAAFEDCPKLTSVTIGKSVTSIGGMAFAYCESLTSVTIPESVTSIGEGTFEGCDSLTEIKVDTNNKNYSSQDGVLFNKNKTELIQYPIGNERKTYDIPKGVTSIDDNAFEGCSKLTSVTIPNSVTSIGERAFWFCDCLTGVTIPDSVTIIGDSAFDSCDSLTDIYILNKDCNIVLPEDPEYNNTIPTETTIHGYAGSTAETFAKENGNKFVAIEGEPVIPDPDKQNAIGDVDGNKNITITDAKWILQNTVKSRTFTEAQAKAADLNKDGKITIVDAKWVLQIVVGLRDAQTLKPIKK